MATSATVFFDGKKCSREWGIVLAAARRAGIGFNLNQGRRTIQDQQHFWWIYKTYGRPLAAYPSPNAPHIRFGQANHAVDIGAPQVYAVAAWLRRYGVRPRWTVRGEPWHIELTLGELMSLVARFNKPNPYPLLRLGARGEAVRTLQKLLRHKNVKGATKVDGSFGPATDRCVRRFQQLHKMKADGVVGATTWAKLRA